MGESGAGPPPGASGQLQCCMAKAVNLHPWLRPLHPWGFRREPLFLLHPAQAIPVSPDLSPCLTPEARVHGSRTACPCPQSQQLPWQRGCQQPWNRQQKLISKEHHMEAGQTGWGRRAAACFPLISSSAASRLPRLTPGPGGPRPQPPSSLAPVSCAECPPLLSPPGSPAQHLLGCTPGGLDAQGRPLCGQL